jgi:hypothetical protein
MTILWCGGEDLDFPYGSAVNNINTGFRSGFARCSLDCSADHSSSRSLSFSGGAITSGWLHCQIGVQAPTNGKLIAGLGLNAAGNGGVFIGSANANSIKCALFTWDGTTVTQIAAETGTSFPGSGTFSLDMQITSLGASSTVNLYINNVLVITYSGSTTITGIASLDCVSLMSFGGNFVVSEFIVGTADTRSMSLLTMAPNAAGDTNNWTTGTYANINPVTINDASVIAVNTTGQDFQANLIDLPSGNFGNVQAVKAIARAEVTAGAVPTALKIGVKTNSTVNVDSGRALTTGFLPYERLMLTNPVTSAAWLASEMNPLQIDLQSA